MHRLVSPPSASNQPPESGLSPSQRSFRSPPAALRSGLLKTPVCAGRRSALQWNSGSTQEARQSPWALYGVHGARTTIPGAGAPGPWKLHCRPMHFGTLQRPDGRNE
ncbi:hypothetical protein CKAH01_01397 [Colletotrichum kahawae]|uniref:Uncharacterized protein n=1 Tax=Colletotrichum kahawae TaxID=34407 RepID=A0AAD9Y5M0_COLKA|nr:hypothetical protein CKAH01_01397 [Colletotrichum kahawae]